MPAIRIPTLVLLTAAALLGGCGTDDDGTGASSSAAAPASGPVAVTAKDFSFSERAVTRAAGKVTFTLANQGKAPHELVLLKSDADPGSLAVSGGRVDEKASVGEIEETEPGATGTHTFDLKPGKYVFVCNIPGHYADGMRGSLTVR